MNKLIKVIVGLLAIVIVWLLLDSSTFEPWISEKWTIHPVLLYIFIGLTLVLLMVSVTLYNLVKKLHAYQTGKVQPKKADKRTGWQRFAGLHSLEAEDDMMLEHEYDGITELDNPTPPWFMYLFYGTIGFAVIYLLNFHVFDTGKLQLEEYTIQMNQAKLDAAEREKKAGESVNENTVTLLQDGAAITAGKATYTKLCAPCHGEEGQGKIGPNLTDEYWLHGGTVKDVFRTIKEGVVQKSMPSWQKQLTPVQIQQVASFILSMKGTHPANPKEPQGDKVN